MTDTKQAAPPPKGKRGGRRPGAGRPPDRHRAKLKKLVDERESTLDGESLIGGESVLEFLNNVALTTNLPLGVRIVAGKAVLPFKHPKLIAIEHAGKGGGPIDHHDVSEREVARRVALILSGAVPPRPDAPHEDPATAEMEPACPNSSTS